MDSAYTNRALAAMMVVMAASFLITIFLIMLIFQMPFWPPSVESVVSAAVTIIVMMAFIIYRARFRDERTVAISDRSARNGFMFFIFIAPSLIVLSSSRPDLFPDVAVTLFGVVASVIIVACLSALYYYRK